MMFRWILDENGLEFVVWIDLARDRDDFRLPQNTRKFLTEEISASQEYHCPMLLFT
jgi:hypothetical protein